MATTYLSRTNSGSGTGDKIFTYSFWIKRTKVDAEHCIAAAGTGQREFIRFEATGELTYRRTSGSAFRFTTLRKFTDVGAWYNIVFNIDSRLGSGGDRILLFVNGVSETAVSAATDMGQNYTPKIGAAELQTIGKDSEQANPYFDGVMSDIHFIDGVRYNASYFGSTDSTTGEWKINTSPNVTYGTNGFAILKNGNTITDQSPNSNNFSLASGAVTNTNDCPDNNFATLNSLDNFYTSTALSHGSTTLVGGNSHAQNNATIALTKGKWYWETKTNDWQGSNASAIGISSEGATATNYEFYNQNGNNVGYGYYSNGSVYGNGGTPASGYGSASGTHIIGVALDLDNNKIAWSYDGTFQGSANPATGANMIAITDPSALRTGFYFPAFKNQSGNKTLNVNFGNGFFGTTAITTNSGNGYAGKEGKSKFNYSVPTNYSAISTKGLNI